jgi:transcriptional regulator with XRE-family HTH domain
MGNIARTGGRGDGFAALLHRYRTRARWSQSGLATAICVDHSYVSRIESGTRMPSLEIVTRIADVLELDATDRATLILAAGFSPEELAPLRDTLARLAGLVDRPESLDIIDLCCHPDMPRATLQAVRHLLRTVLMQARAESEAAA